MLLPLLLIFIVPAWMRLGEFLGYDLFPAPDAAPPRYSSQLLGSFYYIIWWSLVILGFFPSSIVMFPFGDFIPEPMRLWFGLVVVSVVYSGILFLFRIALMSSRHHASEDLVSRTPNDA